MGKLLLISCVFDVYLLNLAFLLTYKLSLDQDYRVYLRTHAKLITFYIEWCSWLRHCAKSQTITGSIPDGVIGIFIDIILPAAL
jgi:hypothetical protein